MTPGILFLAFLLGLLFLATGGLKLMVPLEQASRRFGWANDLDVVSYRAAGWSEMAGGVGLMFPTMVQAVEWLTPVSAGALGLQMLLATALHLRRREWTWALGTSGLVVALVLVFSSSLP